MPRRNRTYQPTSQQMHDSYVVWRQCCQSVQDTYATWATASRARRHVAYADFVAALEREEHAAALHAALVRAAETMPRAKRHARIAA